MTAGLEIVADGLAFPECPRWRDGRLWLSEKRAGRVITVSAAGEVMHIVDVPGGPGGLGWTPDGDLLVVDAGGRRLLRLDGDDLVEVADLTDHTVGRCNDMIADDRGRAYVGHFGYDLLGGAPAAPATLVLVDTGDRTVRTVADDLAFPNGCAFTPDGGELLVAESGANRVTAFRVADDGSLADRRTWADLGSVVPDGIALDRDGALWVSDPVGCAVVRVLEGGEVTSRVDTSAEGGAFACELGGPDGRSLFVCLYTEQASQMAAGAPPVGKLAVLHLEP